VKILFVTSMHATAQFPLRGIVVDRIARALRDDGYDIESVELGSGPPLRYWTARARVGAAVAQFRPAVVHAHFGYSMLAIPNIDVSLVTSFYGDDINGTWREPNGITWKSKLGIGVSQWAAWRSDRCVAVSESLRSRLWTAGWREKTTVIRDAVDFRLFRPLPQATARARLGLAAADILVMFPHDTTQPTKRVGLAEEAVRELQRRVPRARLWVVNGQPPEEMPWYYAAADLMIVTSALEGGPSSVKESLACGVPVVSVRVGDVEMFRDAAQGMTESPADPIALGASLAQALANRPLERQRLLSPSFDIRQAAVALGAVYQATAAASRNGGAS
jgi:glycosyltransferase involved in cell wall biosynthesis